jgi:hypothetical protein
VNPHEFLFKNGLESPPVRPVPGEEDNVAVAFRCFLDIPNFAFAKPINNN